MSSASDLGERDASSGGMLQSISVRDLRSYATLEASFGPGPQLIVGPNAAGKTTLLEAIVLLAWGRSHRTSSDGELVRWGSELARIEGLAGRETVEVALVR
ncbi:MAG TPA: AAA family ATPase, partial [Candidatus Limnocylindrales bacterium]